MSIRQAIDKINEEIVRLQSEREEIQNSCAHRNEVVVKYSWRVGHVEDAYVCEDCDKFIEYVAQRKVREELESRDI